MGLEGRGSERQGLTEARLRAASGPRTAPVFVYFPTPGPYRAWLPPLAHPCLADRPAKETKREREGEREGEEGASELRAFQSSRVLRI